LGENIFRIGWSRKATKPNTEEDEFWKVLNLVMSRRHAIVEQCFIGLLLLHSRQNATPINQPRQLQQNSGRWDLVWNTYSEVGFANTFEVSRQMFCCILSRS